MPMSPFAKKTVFLMTGSAALSIVYYCTAIIGLGFDAVSGFATLIWPPTGIAIAALFMFGQRFALAVAIGAFAANFATGASPLVALGIAAGNAGEAMLAAYLLKRSGFRPEMDRLKDALTFIVQASVLSTLVSPIVGVSSLWLGGMVASSAVARTWTAWWIGDVLGALVIGSLLIVLLSVRKRKIAVSRLGEIAALSCAIIATGVLSFADPLHPWTGTLPVIYTVFVPLLWAALRFGQVGAVSAIFGVSVIAVWGTVSGRGPFVSSSLSESLFFLQLFTGIVSATTLMVGAVNAERRQAEKEVRGFNKELENKVAERTRQLTKAVKELASATEMHAKRRVVLESVLGSIGEGVMAFNTSGNPIIINTTALKILGLSEDDAASPYEWMTKAVPMYYSDGKTLVQFENRPVTMALRGEVFNNERRYIRPLGGEKVLISVSAAPMLDDKHNIVGGVVVFREIPK